MPQLDLTHDETTSTSKPTNRRRQLVFTVVPFLMYLIAECVPLPTIHYPFQDILRFATYSVVSIGILPWVVAAATVELAAMAVPSWRHLRHSDPSGRALLHQTATIMGGFFALVHTAWTSLMLVDEGCIVDPNNPKLFVGLPLGPKPYSSSPLVIFVILSGGTSVVRILAEIVHRRGWGHGVATIFVGWLGVSSVRLIVNISEVVESSDIVQLAINAFIGAMLTMWIVMARRKKIT